MRASAAPVSQNGNFHRFEGCSGATSVLVRLLLVEDVETDAELAVRRLRQDGVQCTYKRIETESAFVEALRENGHDIILSDFSLPQFDGMSALALARRERPDVPFIFVSGTIGEERAIEALRCGAVDYVLKSNLKRLAPAVTRALREAEQKQEREAQQRSIARLTRILEMLSGINTAAAHDCRPLAQPIQHREPCVLRRRLFRNAARARRQPGACVARIAAAHPGGL